MIALARSIKTNVVVPLLSAFVGFFLLASIMAFSVLHELKQQSASSKQLVKHTALSSSRTSNFKPSSNSKSSRAPPRHYVPRSDKSQAINDWFFSSSPADRKRSSASSSSSSKSSASPSGGASRGKMEGVRGRDAQRAVVRSTSQDSITSTSTLASSASSDEEEYERPVRHRRLTMRGGKAVIIDLY